MNNRHIHLFNVQIWLKTGIFAHLSSSNFYTPPLDPKSFDKQRIFLKRSKRLWLQKLDRRLGHMWIMKKYHTNFVNFNKKLYLVIMTLFMMSYFKNQSENYVITTDIKSVGIHLLNYISFRHTQSQIDRANFAYVVLALSYAESVG